MKQMRFMLNLSIINNINYKGVRRVLLYIQLTRACMVVFLFCGFLLLLSNNIILADSIPFAEYSENVKTIKCFTQAEYDMVIAELEALLRAKELHFAQAENVWVKELLFGNKNADETAISYLESAGALSTFQFFSFTEEQARECVLRRLDAAISQGKFVDFCNNFKSFINNHNPPITFFLIEEYFYKHLNQPGLSPEESLFNKQLHNLYLRDLHRSFERFEYSFNVKPTYFSEAMNKVYVASWKLQGKFNIPWDIALQIALKHYFADNIMIKLFGELVMEELFSAKSREEYNEKLVAIAEIYFPIYSYVVDYTNIQDMILILRYHQKNCLALENTVDIIN